MSGKNLGQILIQRRSNQYCATISFENENYLHEEKTKQSEEKILLSKVLMMMIETVSENEKTEVWDKKDISTRKMDVRPCEKLNKTGHGLSHSHGKYMSWDILMSTTLIFFINNDDVLIYTYSLNLHVIFHT